MDLAEKIAKSVVEELIPRARMRFREQQHDGSHDFDLILPDNTTAALEVTASKDFPLERTNAAIRLEKHGGHFIPTVKCQNDWSIDPLPNARINRVRAEADYYLPGLRPTDSTSSSTTRMAEGTTPCAASVKISPLRRAMSPSGRTQDKFASARRVVAGTRATRWRNRRFWPRPTSRTIGPSCGKRARPNVTSSCL